MSNLSARTLALTIAGITATSMLAVPNAGAAPDNSLPVISEVYGGGGNNGAAYSHDFIELYNPTSTDIDLSGWTLSYYAANGNLGTSTTLSGSIPANNYFLVQQSAGSNTSLAALPTPDVTGNANMSGSQGSVMLLDASGTEVDLLGWGATALFEGAPATKTTNSTSAQRILPGGDTDNNAADVRIAEPTPQSSGAVTPVDPIEPVEPGTPVSATIAEIQGTGAASPLAGQRVTTEGVVTAVYQEGGFSGFYVQTAGTGTKEKVLGDASDGLFVYLGDQAAYPDIGASVSVTGEATEYYGLTQLSKVSVTESNEAFEAITPIAMTTMAPGEDLREAYEGMLVQPTGDYTVTNNYDLNSFGTLGLAAGTQPYYQGTDVAAPGAAASAVEAANQSELVTLDDGRSRNYTQTDKNTPLPWIVQDGSTITPIRTGDAVDFQHPVIFDYRYDLWNFQPTTPVTGTTTAADLPISWEDSRAAELEAIGHVAGDFHIASFNVLNYFTSLGVENSCDSYTDKDGTPVTARNCSVRGAYTPEALSDQQGKIVAAINKLDVDVLGLEEIENSATITGNPAQRDQALHTLVDALNAAHGTTRWAAVDSPTTVGTDEDAIRVAFIYDTTTVTPVGDSRIFDDPAFTGTARQPLAQEFQPLDGSKESFVGVVNHFKSKGSVSNGDVDTGDGQGANAKIRVAQSQALLDHLDKQDDWAAKPVFILGDLNSYSHEDALSTLLGGGFTNLVDDHDGGSTYQFSGRIGSLDHALGNDLAAQRVVDTEVWDINADESIAFEYSRRNYNAVDVFEADNVFRSSDHDPIKVGFTLNTVGGDDGDDDDEPISTPGSSIAGTIFSVILAIVGVLGFALPLFQHIPWLKKLSSS